MRQEHFLDLYRETLFWSSTVVHVDSSPTTLAETK